MDRSQDFISALRSVQWDIQDPITTLENSDILVFSYKLSDGSPALTKVILYSPDYFHELSVLRTLTHPSLSKVCRDYWLVYNAQNYWAAELERGGRALWAEIKDRSETQHYWSEGEMLYYLHALVDALAVMQSQGITHGHIRPHNIFVAGGLLRLGDFGLLMDLQQKTLLIEEVFFQSPIMNVYRPASDAYKFDVYCLGLTFLAMANLDVKKGGVDALIDQIHYGDPLKEVLRGMLQSNEAQRCSYTELSERLLRVLQVIECPVALNSVKVGNPRSIRKVQRFHNSVCILISCSRLIQPQMRIVSLSCNSEHAFCSPACFLGYIEAIWSDDESAQIVCPLCKLPVADGLLAKASKFLYESRQGCIDCSVY